MPTDRAPWMVWKELPLPEWKSDLGVYFPCKRKAQHSRVEPHRLAILHRHRRHFHLQQFPCPSPQKKRCNFFCQVSSISAIAKLKKTNKKSYMVFEDHIRTCLLFAEKEDQIRRLHILAVSDEKNNRIIPYATRSSGPAYNQCKKRGQQ